MPDAAVSRQPDQPAQPKPAPGRTNVTPPPELVAAVARQAYATSIRHEPDAPEWKDAPEWAVASYMNMATLYLGALFDLSEVVEERETLDDTRTSPALMRLSITTPAHRVEETA